MWVTLSRLYYNWLDSLHAGDVCNTAYCAIWLQTRYDYERKHARGIARIFNNWLVSGYTPSRNYRGEIKVMPIK